MVKSKMNSFLGLEFWGILLVIMTSERYCYAKPVSACPPNLPGYYVTDDEDPCIYHICFASNPQPVACQPNRGTQHRFEGTTYPCTLMNTKCQGVLPPDYFTTTTTTTPKPSPQIAHHSTPVPSTTTPGLLRNPGAAADPSSRRRVRVQKVRRPLLARSLNGTTEEGSTSNEGGPFEDVEYFLDDIMPEFDDLLDGKFSEREENSVGEKNRLNSPNRRVLDRSISSRGINDSVNNDTKALIGTMTRDGKEEEEKVQGGALPKTILEVVPDSRIPNGREVCEICALDVCLVICYNTLDCAGVDYDFHLQRCYLHRLQDLCKPLQPRLNTTHYKRALCDDRTPFVPERDSADSTTLHSIAGLLTTTLSPIGIPRDIGGGLFVNPNLGFESPTVFPAGWLAYPGYNVAGADSVFHAATGNKCIEECKRRGPKQCFAVDYNAGFGQCFIHGKDSGCLQLRQNPVVYHVKIAACADPYPQPTKVGGKS